MSDADCNSASGIFGGACGSGAAQSGALTVSTLIASIVGALAGFGVQLLIFALLRLRLERIYRPRTYLVPEKDRVPAPPQGLIGWLYPVLETSNLTIIKKCGLDAYFFLRFLRLQVKIFFPAALIILPVLLAVNATSGGRQEGLDRLSISNVSETEGFRLWAHTLLACFFLLWAFYHVFTELRGYVRVRQAHLTSPQHRLRASATTVLVSGIPQKWLTHAALSGLFDVYPGGIRNIWINRNYDALAAKIEYRTKIARSLEDAETVLIKNCRSAHNKSEKKKAKEAGIKSKTSQEKKQDRAAEDAAANRTAEGEGVSAGERHEVPEGVEHAVEEGDEDSHQVEHKDKRAKSGSNTNERPTNVDGTRESHASDETTLARPSSSSRPPQNAFEIEEPQAHRKGHSLLKLPADVFKNNDESFNFPSPQPAFDEDDQFPLRRPATPQKESEAKKTWLQKLAFWEPEIEPFTDYAEAYTREWDEDQDGEPYWRRYLDENDRETIRLPLFSPSWWPSIPLVGKKVDRIYHCRRELARLNLEIEDDQNHPERFPLMNSAFIQFNHQIAAHMCCQSLSHHVPQQMTPRLVEISPDDVIWENMSIKWWSRLIRSGVVFVLSAGLIILYAPLVAFTSLLNRVSDLVEQFPWMSWLNRAPNAVISIIQGVLPPALLSLILLLVPIIFRFFVLHQGVPTGNTKELGVQAWVFAFLFIQVFLVATITGGLFQIATALAQNPASIVTTISSSLPKASTYFFSYLIVQAFSNSASALIQIGSLLGWFILAPLFDSTARQKWRRQTNLNKIQWGSFFPQFANFAAIGIIYSVVAPLIMVFSSLIFGLFWIVYRYNVLFVYQFRHDTGGLLFPRAIYHMFIGFYFMEICLIGIFFTSRNEDGSLCYPQAIVMIVALLVTILFQVQVNKSFQPLFQYLPITLEDEAVLRDEAFAKAQESKFAPLSHGADHAVEERDNSAPKRVDSQEPQEPEAASEKDKPENLAHEKKHDRRPLWKTQAWGKAAPEAVARLRYLADGKKAGSMKKDHDVESQQHTVGDVLYGDFADEIEDLTPEDRDLLVRYAFQHSALRARRPVVWIPRDTLGVSDDEIGRAKKMSTVLVNGKEETNIWMSNEGAAIDGKGRVVFRKSPPDFSNVDLVAL